MSRESYLIESKDGRIEIKSKSGIEYSVGDNGRKFLIIPNNVIDIIGGDKFRKRIFPSIFDGSYYAWAERYESSFKVELPSNTTQEKIQQLVDEIEKSLWK